jgi:hypothetical protein
MPRFGLTGSTKATYSAAPARLHALKQHRQNRQLEAGANWPSLGVGFAFGLHAELTRILDGDGYGPKAWRLPWGGPSPQDWVKPDLFVDLARAMERACFDYIMIEDSSNIPYTYKNSHETYVRLAIDSPKLDPAVLAHL